MPDTYDGPFLEADTLLEGGRLNEPKRHNDTKFKCHAMMCGLDILALSMASFSWAVATEEKPLEGCLSGALLLNVVFCGLHMFNENKLIKNPESASYLISNAALFIQLFFTVISGLVLLESYRSGASDDWKLASLAVTSTMAGNLLVSGMLRAPNCGSSLFSRQQLSVEEGDDLLESGTPQAGEARQQGQKKTNNYI
jgi:hypothetical protein